METPPTQRPLRILVVEDQSLIRDAVQATIEDYFSFINSQEAVIDTAEDGMAALKNIFANQTYDVLLTDMMMPRLGGIGLIKILKLMSYPAYLIANSGYSLEPFINEWGDEPPHYFIPKPFSIDEMEKVFLMIRDRLERGIDGAHSGPLMEGLVGEKKTALLKEESGPVRDAGNLTIESTYPYLIGGLIHDSLNTLTAMRYKGGKLKNINPGAQDELSPTADALLLGMEHLEKVLRLIQNVSREHYATGQAGSVRADECIAPILEHYSQGHPDIQYTLDQATGPDQIHLPVGILSFIIGELLENATRAMRQGGQRIIQLRLAVSQADGTLSIECRDGGPGFPEPIVERIRAGRLEPPRRAGQHGYGLYLIREIVGRLNGTLLVSNPESGGGRLELLIPLKGNHP